MLISVTAIVALTLADRLLKIWMTALLADGPIVLIPGIIQLRYIKNTGMAFGIWSGKQLLLIILTALLMVVLLYLLIKKANTTLQKISLVMIVAGGFGNLIDRVFAGYVVDYIEPLFVNFAIFNLADILINIGCLLFVISIIFFDKHAVKSHTGKKDA